MSVVGSISIRDNASSVLKSIRQEQTALRKDAAETRKELQRAWDKTYTAKINTESATRKTDGLTGKVKQLGKTVISPVIKAKDAASATITKVSNGIKTVGKKVATPVIKIKDSATSKVKSIKNALTGVAKKVTTPVIKLKDAITSKVTKITGKLKALGGKIFSPIVRLKDATASGISAISGKLKTLAATVAIPVTIVATAVVGGAVMEGAALEQSIGGVETLFKENASVVKANADAAFKTAGLSANEYMSQVTSFSASLLSSLGGDTAKAAEVADMAMIDMADNANKFGTDMESIQNAYQGFAKQNYTMLDNLKLGYGGTQEEMQRLLQDASKISGVKYDISNLSDVYSAIHVIQNELGVTGTTAKEAGQTFSGSFSAMKAAAKNVLGNMAIGGDITGSMEQLVDSASTFLFDNAVPMIGRVFSSLPSVVKTGVKKAVIDIVISVFEILFGVVQKVFPGIQSIIETVWGIVKPLVEGIGSVIGKIAGWFGSVADAITGSGGDSGTVGENAEGDNNWKGGLTWVGEKGAELVDLPRGSRILPHKESVSLTKQGSGVVKDSTANIMQNTVLSGGGQDLTPIMMILTSIDENLKQLMDRIKGKESGLEVPGSGKTKGTAKGFIGSVTVAIAKLADEIIVREDADIDEIADKVAKKVVEVVVNMG